MSASIPSPSAPPRGTTTHAIMPRCPLDCLRPVVSAGAFEPLAREHRGPAAPLATVGDVITLCRQRQLTEIWGVGPRRAGEIEAALILAGLDLTEHHH